MISIGSSFSSGIGSWTGSAAVVSGSSSVASGLASSAAATATAFSGAGSTSTSSSEGSASFSASASTSNKPSFRKSSSTFSCVSASAGSFGSVNGLMFTDSVSTDSSFASAIDWASNSCCATSSSAVSTDSCCSAGIGAKTGSSTTTGSTDSGISKTALVRSLGSGEIPGTLGSAISSGFSTIFGSSCVEDSSNGFSDTCSEAETRASWPSEVNAGYFFFQSSTAVSICVSISSLAMATNSSPITSIIAGLSAPLAGASVRVPAEIDSSVAINSSGSGSDWPSEATISVRICTGGVWSSTLTISVAMIRSDPTLLVTINTSEVSVL